METFPRITDSFPRRRRPGRTPSKGKKGKKKRKIHPRDPSPAPPADPELLDMLRRFDLTWEYGPCTGITRLQRWERAQALGLSPPASVLEALLEHRDHPDVTYCLWHQYPL